MQAYYTFWAILTAAVAYSIYLYWPHPMTVFLIISHTIMLLVFVVWPAWSFWKHK